MKLSLPYQSSINPKTTGVRVLKSINWKVIVNFVIAHAARCEIVQSCQMNSSGMQQRFPSFFQWTTCSLDE
jgi:hypothetical protein